MREIFQKFLIEKASEIFFIQGFLPITNEKYRKRIPAVILSIEI